MKLRLSMNRVFHQASPTDLTSAITAVSPPGTDGRTVPGARIILGFMYEWDMADIHIGAF